MRSNLVYCGSEGRIVRKESDNEVLKILGEFLPIHFLEVDVCLALDEQIVEVFLSARFFEGENTLDQDKYDDTKGEQINLGALVVLALLDFWCHVGHCATVALQAFNVFVAGKTEVCDFDVELVVKKDVFEFQITVTNSIRVHELKRLKHLQREESACVFTHPAS